MSINRIQWTYYKAFVILQFVSPIENTKPTYQPTESSQWTVFPAKAIEAALGGGGGICK